jgi:hypothetical protein
VVSTSPITSSANTAAVASSPLPVVAAVPSAAVVETHPRDADADADAALVAERQSVAQLQTLLVAFETSQLDRLKLVSLEEAEVARIADVQAQPQHDAGTREELAAWRARKVASIAAEREVANEMGHCVAGLRDEIAAGTLDAGVLWGPVAGYYAKRAKTPLVVIPLVREHDAPMDFRISMAVRRSDQEWKRTLNKLIAENQSEINRILIDFGVPIVDEPGKSITP